MGHPRPWSGPYATCSTHWKSSSCHLLIMDRIPPDVEEASISQRFHCAVGMSSLLVWLCYCGNIRKKIFELRVRVSAVVGRGTVGHGGHGAQWLWLDFIILWLLVDLSSAPWSSLNWNQTANQSIQNNCHPIIIIIIIIILIKLRTCNVLFFLFFCLFQDVDQLLSLRLSGSHPLMRPVWFNPRGLSVHSQALQPKQRGNLDVMSLTEIALIISSEQRKFGSP